MMSLLVKIALILVICLAIVTLAANYVVSSKSFNEKYQQYGSYLVYFAGLATIVLASYTMYALSSGENTGN